MTNSGEINAVYQPKNDITAYELALLLPYVMGLQNLTRKELDIAEHLCPNISRHLHIDEETANDEIHP